MIKDKSANKKLRYEMGTALPQLAGADNARVEKFNRAVANLVAARTGEFRKDVNEQAREEAAARQDAESPSSPSFLEVGYEVAAASKDFISVLFTFYGYLSGAAHPNTTTRLSITT